MSEWICLACEARNSIASPLCGSLHCQLARAGAAIARPVAQVSSKTKARITYSYDDPEFNAFWDAYRRKKNKYATLRKWSEVRKSGVPANVIIEGAERFAREMRHVELKYIPYPDRWLANGRWDDENTPDPIDAAEERARQQQERTAAYLRGEVDEP